MISEGTLEEWSDDAKNSALITEINYILKHPKQKTTILSVVFHNIRLLFYCIFESNTFNLPLK